MLPSKNRLANRKEIAAVARGGQYFSLGAISLKAKRNEKSRPRIGFSIGLKFSKKAVERNVAKRKLRAIVGILLPKIKENADILVMMKKMPKEASYEDLKRNVEAVFKKANII